MTLQLALVSRALARRVPAIDQLDKLNSVHARPMPRYLFGRISVRPASVSNIIFASSYQSLPAYATEIVPMEAPRMTSPAISAFIVFAVQATIPPTIVRVCPKRITYRRPKISERRPAIENPTAAAAPQPEGILLSKSWSAMP